VDGLRGDRLGTKTHAAVLRDEIHLRNLNFASLHSLAIYLSRTDNGDSSDAWATQKRVVLYEPSEEGSRHGNFLDVTYRAILNQENWRRRLSKSHPTPQCLPKTGRAWRELDSSNSSDALLMNVFCHPDALASGILHDELEQPRNAQPEFGVPGDVPLVNGTNDNTEIDLRLGTLFLEAKLTEGDFKNKPKVKVERYRDFREVFECSKLPSNGEEYVSYQLIRNVLAAHANGTSSCVLIDARRPDLRALWEELIRCVRIPELRNRCHLRTWQCLASDAPDDLRRFLQEKYGIEAETN
jgi:hypothetical protein